MRIDRLTVQNFKGFAERSLSSLGGWMRPRIAKARSIC